MVALVVPDRRVADAPLPAHRLLRAGRVVLQHAGIHVIQVDEPALRELLPLRAPERPAYLAWATEAFRLATGVAAPDVQIHTHMCYAEFGNVLEAIEQLDADVISLEAARSRMQIAAELDAARYPRGVGPGVYDIHSPRVPSEQEVTDLLELAARHVDPARLWANPDCGLKTRGYAEVEPALANLVGAARTIRTRLPAR
jgi:5-methyltetrahydropteroyltriglutamate--homocysteine methyltransferase